MRANALLKNFWASDHIIFNSTSKKSFSYPKMLAPRLTRANANVIISFFVCYFSYFFKCKYSFFVTAEIYEWNAWLICLRSNKELFAFDMEVMRPIVVCVVSFVACAFWYKLKIICMSRCNVHRKSKRPKQQHPVKYFARVHFARVFNRLFFPLFNTYKCD